MSENFIEIINKNIFRGKFKHAVFDFDGTISLVREGWQQIMIPYFVGELNNTPKGTSLDPAHILKLATDFVEYNTGKQTIYQCMSLANKVNELGGNALDPLEYKEEYHRRLLGKISARLEGLENKSICPKEYIVAGALQLLDTLQKNNVQLYLASGTDEEYVLNEARLLGVSKYFGRHIYGAQKDHKTFSKKKVISKIISENRLFGYELMGFGDGYVEIENIKEVGGFACGVASDEAGRVGIDRWKRARLISAGADIIIPHYAEIGLIEKYLFI